MLTYPGCKRLGVYVTPGCNQLGGFRQLRTQLKRSTRNIAFISNCNTRYIRRHYDLSKKNCPSCLPEYLRFFCFDLSKLCEIRKQLEIIYPALLSISFYLYSFRNESVLKMHMHFGWGKKCLFTLLHWFCCITLSHYIFALFLSLSFFHYVPSIPGQEGSDSYPS